MSKKCRKTFIAEDDVDGFDPFELAVYFWLSMHADKNGRCHPAQKTLAKKSKMSLSQVKVASKKLKDRGAIEIETNAKSGRVNSYKILKKEQKKPLEYSPEGSHHVARYGYKAILGSHHKARGSHHKARGSHHVATNNIYITNYYNNKDYIYGFSQHIAPAGQEKLASKKEQKALARFELIWKFYPKRKGSNPKKIAKSCFLARVKDGEKINNLVRAAINYKRECIKLRQIDTIYVVQARTFFGKGEFYAEYINKKIKKTITEKRFWEM